MSWVVKSYIFIFPNPFNCYLLDFDGIGHIEVNCGFFTETLNTYDMAITTSPRCTATLVQRIFGLGDVSFDITDGHTIHTIYLKNIRKHKQIAYLCCKHHKKMNEIIFNNTRYFREYAS